MLYKIKTTFRRFLTRLFVPHRSGSYPFITSDTFRNLANHVHDEAYICNAKEVLEGDIVFIRTNQLDDFFDNVLPQIANRFIIISHNDDISVDKKFEAIIENKKIIHWFAENASFMHPKLTPLPLGIYSRFYDKQGLTVEYIKKYSGKKKKFPRIFYSFSLITSPVKRGAILEILKKIPLCEGLESGMLPKEEYFDAMTSSMLVAAPQGNGEDTHRIWEALCTGTVPVVQRTPSTEYWKKMGLPLYLIDEWEELSTMTEKELIDIYEWAKPLFSNKAIWMPFWIEQFEKAKLITLDHDS
jgi:hypothetical protein